MTLFILNNILLTRPSAFLFSSHPFLIIVFLLFFLGKPEITGIEEPQDHGDGNFRQLTNEETWQRLMSQVEEKKKIKNQFYSEVHEKNKPDKISQIPKTENQKLRKRDDSQSPKKSKWSLVSGAAKPMSSSSDASTQCTILQEKEPSSRKRKREQLAKHRIIREEVLIERTIPIENEKIVIKKIPTQKKKEVTFDYNEITISEKEEINDVDNFLIPRKSREKEMTDYTNFLAKSEICEIRPKNDFRKKLQLWKNQRSKRIPETIQESEKEFSNENRESFYHCACFQVFCRVINNFFKTGR